jgi:hypothetical protein
MFSHAHYLPTTPLKTNEKLWVGWIGFSEAVAPRVAEGENNRPGPCPDNRSRTTIPPAKFALQNYAPWDNLAPWEDRSQSAPSWQFLSAAHAVRNRREN